MWCIGVVYRFLGCLVLFVGVLLVVLCSVLVGG